MNLIKNWGVTNRICLPLLWGKIWRNWATSLHHVNLQIECNMSLLRRYQLSHRKILDNTSFGGSVIRWWCGCGDSFKNPQIRITQNNPWWKKNTCCEIHTWRKHPKTRFETDDNKNWTDGEIHIQIFHSKKNHYPKEWKNPQIKCVKQTCCSCPSRQVIPGRSSFPQNQYMTLFLK